MLTGGTGGLALSPTPDAASNLAHADALTRRFDFAALPVEALMQRLRQQSRMTRRRRRWRGGQDAGRPRRR